METFKLLPAISKIAAGFLRHVRKVAPHAAERGANEKGLPRSPHPRYDGASHWTGITKFLELKIEEVLELAAAVAVIVGAGIQ